MARDHAYSDIRRKNTNSKTPKKFILYVEGRNTEKSYFDLLKRNNCKVMPVTKPGKGIGSCVEFVTETDKKFNSLPQNKRSKYLQKWIVFDYDGHEDFADAIKLARKRGFQVAFSSMCIEYWFVLHFYNHNGDPIPLRNDSHSQAQIDMINLFIKNHNKESKGMTVKLYDEGSKMVEEDFFDLMMEIDPGTHHSRIIDAYFRAKSIHSDKKGKGAEFNESVTTMYELMKELGVISENKKGELVLNQ